MSIIMRQTLPIHRFFTTILFLAVTTLTWAYDFVVDGIYYSKNTDGTSVTVTYKTSLDRGYSGSVVIPSTVTYDGKAYSITSIGSDAFSGCISLTSITIPESVTSIGSDAFWNCIGLTSITIPESVNSIGDYAFQNCTSLTSITIPNSVTNIGDYAFSYCSGLTSVTIPNSVTSIGRYTFASCFGLTSIIIDKNNPKYDSRNNCNAIIETKSNTLIAGCQKTIIPNSVTSIGRSAFSGCTGLTSVTIPNSVTSIGYEAFNDCFRLTSITIPNSVKSIGSGAFSGCLNLTKAEFASIESLCKIKFEISYSNPLRYAEHLYINGKEVTDVVIPNSVTSINDYAFYNCSGLTSVTIPESVTSIGTEAFYNCSGLTSVTCHAQNVPSTGTSVFYYVPQSTATLYVPAESVEAYKSASQWKNFGTILPITPTAVESLTADEASDTDKDDAAIYDLHGRRMQHKPAHGYYIQGGKKYLVK